MKTLGALIPQLLVERGIDTVFGIPGVHTVEMYRGLPGSGLRHVTPRHEQGAGFMADGHYRATGRVAACFIITGPGMTNIATAMGQAYGDSIPMIVISSVNAEGEIGRGLGCLHEMQDQSATIAGVAAWSRRVRDAGGLAAALDDALDLFAAGRPRPVHIEIPIDRLSASAEAPPMRPRAAAKTPAPDDVAEAARMLNGAERPVLILGGGAVRLGPAAEALAEALGAPTLMTSNARGLLPPDHPLNAGGGLFAPPQRALLAESDAALALGCEFGPTDWSYFGEGDPVFGGALIRVDVDADQLRRGAAPTLPIEGDAEAFAAALSPRLSRAPAPTPDLSACRDAPRTAGEDRVGRHIAVLDAIWAAHPDAIVVGDSAEPAYGGLIGARAPGPRQWFTTATGFGTLGYALPAAMGAAIARPGAPVVALVGDGGALYTLPELAAAAEARLPVILLIWNNDGYGEIRHFMQDRQITPEGVNLSPVDFEALARGFGAAYGRAADAAEVAAAIGAAKVRRGPTVIEMREGEWRF